MDDESSARLERIEAHVTHLEHQVEQLNEVIVAQGKVIAQLQRQLQRQAATLEGIELERVKGTNPKPPHYQ